MGECFKGVDTSAVVEVFPVLVCLDYALGSVLVNGFLQRGFASALRGRGHREARTAPRVNPLTVMRIDDLEGYLPYTEPSLPGLLMRWHAEDPNMLSSPSAVIDDVLSTYPPRANEWLVALSTTWSEDMLRRLFPGTQSEGEA